MSLDRDAAAQVIEWLLEQHLRRLARTVAPPRTVGTHPGVEAGHALAEMLDRAEHDYDHALLTADGFDPSSEWTKACMRQADRVVLLVSRPPEPDRLVDWGVPSGSDVVLLGGAGNSQTGRMPRALEPRASHRVQPDTRVEDIARLARRLTGRSVGLSLSGGET